MRKTAGMRRAGKNNGGRWRSSREIGPGITVVFFLFPPYNSDESVEKSKYGCSVCKKKSQLSPFQRAKAYTNDVESYFGMTIVKNAEELSKSTDGPESRFIMLVLSPVIFLTVCLSLSANAFFFTFKRSDAGSLE